jgi:hypothetical protein
MITTSWIYKYPPEIDVTKVELNDKLLSLLGSEELVARWWHTGNRYWDGETPYSIWIRNPEDVEKYVAFFCYK